MEYALRLPENERAHADRMKIITPEIIGENQFVIKVGNSLVMEFFTKEIKAITQYIEDGTKCRNVTMKIEIEEQQTRRRIYDRTEQFKLLTEKNLLRKEVTEEEFPYRFFVSDAADKFKEFANTILPYDVEKTQQINLEEY